MSWFARLRGSTAYTYMTPEELVAARTTLALTPEHFADRLHLTRYELDALEAGARAVTPQLAYEVRLALVTAEREHLAASCDLPACDDRARLAARVERAHRKLGLSGPIGVSDYEVQDFDVRYTTQALATHERTCATCRARATWVERHAPPNPELPALLFERPAAGPLLPLAAFARRLPRFLHPPPGQAGQGRRSAPVYAVVLSAVATFHTATDSAAHVLDGELLAAARSVAMLGLVLPAIVVACSVGGAIADAARARGHRLGGHLLRYGVLTPYAIGVGLAFLSLARDFDRRTAGWMLAIVALSAVVGATLGALDWVVKRLRGRLPRPLVR